MRSIVTKLWHCDTTQRSDMWQKKNARWLYLHDIVLTL